MAEYLLIQKKVRDMIIYNNIMLKQFPKHEKYLLANKIREYGYELLELVITVNKKFQKKTTFSEMNEAPKFEDRIVQHALMNAIKEVVENRFVYDTYACRENKGTHAANNRLKKFLVNYKNKGYYLKVDIRKFFYSIDHATIISQLNRIIKCKHTIELLIKFFKNKSGKGLPLGSITSQLLANLALNPVDHLIKRILKIKHYVRYMDDLILLSFSKSQLRYALRKIKDLVSLLMLSINNKTIISKIGSGIDFVGYRTFYNCRLIRKRSLFKIKRMLKKTVDVNTITSFLSHSKRTNSLKYVFHLVATVESEYKTIAMDWLRNNNYRLYNEILQS